METQLISKKAVISALSLAAVGLFVGGTVIAWIAGSLSISHAAAEQIMAAINIGGWAITIVAGMFSMGIGGALIATARWLATRKGTAVAVA